MYYIDYSQSYMPTRQVSFICDTPDDLADLPTSTREGTPQAGDSSIDDKVVAGSTCLCISTSDVYMLNSDDVWKKL